MKQAIARRDVNPLRIAAASLALVVWMAGGNGVPRAGAEDSTDCQFDVTFLPPNFWQGTVTGTFSGRTQAAFRLLGTEGVTWHLSSAWSVDAGANSFVAQLKGIYNAQTGQTTMNGNVTEGYRMGRPVHLDGNLVSVPQRFRFTGTLRITP
jgi:hypothetical protein